MRHRASLFATLLLTTTAYAQVNVWTHHNDNGRTGANLAETQLSTSNVNSSQFGKLFGYSVDAPVFAQPLIISNLSIPGKGVRNVVFVATMNNSVYAFDADDPTVDSYQPLWQVSFNNAGAGITPVPSSDISASANYSGPYGIMGTPVIDQASGTMYLVSRTKENGSYFQRLRALDITTGQQRTGSGVAITASVTNPDSSVTVFSPIRENQRPALALGNGRVYISWASQEDIAPYQGWVIGYNTANLLQQPVVFNAAPTGGGMAGIWMSGEAPAIDANGNVYVTTGNGAWDGNINFAQSVIKLSPSLAVLDWFTPDNWQTTSNGDVDLGSSGALLIPGTQYAATGSKEGRLFLLNTANMGHMVAGNTQIPQLFQASGGRHIHGTPVYWDGPSGKRLYLWAEEDYLKAFSFSGSSFNTSAVSQSTFKAPGGMPGGMLSLSASGNTAGTGIVWASTPLSLDANPAKVSGVLRAFDATDLTNKLWDSQANCSDQVGTLAKYVPPTVANGKVYLATFSNQLLVYGPRSAAPPTNPNLAGSVACDASSVNLTAVGTTDWAKWPNYLHKATGGAQISNYTVSGDVPTSYFNYARTISWSDGTPTASGSDQAGVYVSQNGGGFQVTAPADTTRRTLSLYVAGFNGAGRLTAHLSDSSAPDYVNSLSGWPDPSVSTYFAVYTIAYQAASSGQQLVVNWTHASDSGTLSLQAAALVTPPPIPATPTGVTATSGTSATSVTVSWAASTGATSYTVYRSTTAGSLGSSVGTTNTTSLTDTTVVPSILYYYSVVATGTGGSSAPSQQASGYAGTLGSTYQLSGTVRVGGAGLSGVSFTATGGVTCTNTSATGAYSCSVPQGWSGTVTPALANYTFTPAARSYSSVAANQSAQDYTAVLNTGNDTVWVEDALPAGAVAGTDGGSVVPDGWVWVSSNPAPYSGALAHQSVIASATHQHYFWNATGTLSVGTGDTLFAYVYLDPANPPRELMLQWNDGTWLHRAYWGENLINFGADGTVSRRSMGALPPVGQWVRLEVPAAQVGLEGSTLNGMAFTLYGGRAIWDRAGKTSP